MDRFIIDRFEGETAVCETEDINMVDIPRNILPDNAHEGDCLVFENGHYRIDKDETMKRRTIIERKAKNLFRD